MEKKNTFRDGNSSEDIKISIIELTKVNSSHPSSIYKITWGSCENDLTFSIRFFLTIPIPTLQTLPSEHFLPYASHPPT